MFLLHDKIMRIRSEGNGTHLLQKKKCFKTKEQNKLKKVFDRIINTSPLSPGHVV